MTTRDLNTDPCGTGPQGVDLERDQADIVEDRSVDVPRAKLFESVVLEIVTGKSASLQ